MNSNSTYNYLEKYLHELQSEGVYSFTLEEIKNRFLVTPEAIKKSLQRLKLKNRIARIRYGFYVIIPPEYSAAGILPTTFYIEKLMNFLQRDYYAGLLSAAMLHGVSHQQPQRFFIMTHKPYLRDIENDKVRIKFPIKKSWVSNDIISMKTETGYIKVSTPEMTALDLVLYHDIAGGFNRVVTLLDELAEFIDGHKLVNTTKRFGQISTIQRLGYLLDNVLSRKEKSNQLYDWLKDQVFFPVLLRPGTYHRNMKVNNRWKVIKNVTPKSDL